MVEKSEKRRPFGRLRKRKSDDNIKNILKAHDKTVWPGFIWFGTGTLVITIQAR